MPYINKQTRTEYEDYIMVLADKLQGQPAGDVNYVISKLLWTLLDKDRSYTKANDLLGALTACSYEFYRRKVAPYEDSKIGENGDL